MVWESTERAEVLNWACPPERGTVWGLKLPRLSLKVTVPVGSPPWVVVTVAVNVTEVPDMEGLLLVMTVVDE
jgi:hypothetical protein